MSESTGPLAAQVNLSVTKHYYFPGNFPEFLAVRPENFDLSSYDTNYFPLEFCYLSVIEYALDMAFNVRPPC
jgi:hypothetical protein